jgi:SagB-type dehydrogenase family enzyme
MEDSFGDFFQEKSKYDRNEVSGERMDWNKQPERYKTYPQANQTALPSPNNSMSHSLESLLHDRHSVRKFSKEPLSLDQLSYLLWASSGIRQIQGNFEFRTVPSAGALYPIETYLVINNVDQLPQGIYHYNIRMHSIEEIQLGNFSIDIAKGALDQDMAAKAPIVFVWAAMFQRSKWKYHQRAYRYIYLDAGHIAENLALAAVDLDLGSCQIGALYDQEINTLLFLDGTNESVIYLSVVGKPY